MDETVGQKNAVLRGGLFDGYAMNVSSVREVRRQVDRTVYVYRPTAEMDDEFPQLMKYVLDRSEPI